MSLCIHLDKSSLTSCTWDTQSHVGYYMGYTWDCVSPCTIKKDFSSMSKSHQARLIRVVCCTLFTLIITQTKKIAFDLLTKC